METRIYPRTQRDSMTMVQQNFHFNTQAHYSSLGFVTAQEIQNTTNNKKKTEAKP